MKAMILAAGRGERLRPLTDSTPKALVEVRGKPLLEYHLERVSAAGVREVVINLGWLGEQVAEFVGDGSRWGLSACCSDERGNVLETGGGIHKALPLLGDAPFFVVNADIYTDMPMPDVDLGEDDAHLVLVRSPAYRDGGDFGLDGDRVTNDPVYTFSGASFYKPSFFDGCEAGRFSVVPMLREAIDDGRVSGSLYEGQWADVGTPERLASLQES